MGVPPPQMGMPPPMGAPPMGGMAPPPMAQMPPPQQSMPEPPPLVLPRVAAAARAENDDEPPPPGDDVDEGAKSPPPEFFDDPLPCEVAYGVEEEKKGREAALLAAGGPVAPVEPTPAHGWRVVANGGVRYWYNERTGVSQWEEPAEVSGKDEPKRLYDPAVGPKNDDFEALCQAAEGDSICDRLEMVFYSESS